MTTPLIRSSLVEDTTPAKEYTLEWRKLTEADRAELETYCTRGEELWGARYPVDYLLRGVVHAAFEPDGTMVGGFALVPGPGLRTLSVLTPEMRQASALMCSTPDSDFNEIAGIWFKPTVAYMAGRSDLMWERFHDAVLQVEQPYIIFGYNFDRNNLAMLYSLCETTILYRGPARSANAVQNNHHTTISVEATTPPTIAAVVAGLVSYTRKALAASA